MRLLADEDVPGPIVRDLRQKGHDVGWVAESPGARDPDVLARAGREDRVLLTFDRDFGELVFRTRQPAGKGVVLARLAGLGRDETCRLVVEALLSRQDWEGNFSIIEPDRIRMRPLP